MKYHCFNLTYGPSGKDYRDATLSKFYLTVTAIVQSLKSIGQS